MATITREKCANSSETSVSSASLGFSVLPIRIGSHVHSFATTISRPTNLVVHKNTAPKRAYPQEFGSYKRSKKVSTSMETGDFHIQLAQTVESRIRDKYMSTCPQHNFVVVGLCGSNVQNCDDDSSVVVILNSEYGVVSESLLNCLKFTFKGCTVSFINPPLVYPQDVDFLEVEITSDVENTHRHVLDKACNEFFTVRSDLISIFLCLHNHTIHLCFGVRYKGFVPLGEKRFPEMYENLPTCEVQARIKPLPSAQWVENNNKCPPKVDECSHEIGPGSSIGPSGEAGSGTLGGFVHLKGEVYGLTCQHVLISNDYRRIQSIGVQHPSKDDMFETNRVINNANILNGVKKRPKLFTEAKCKIGNVHTEYCRKDNVMIPHANLQVGIDVCLFKIDSGAMSRCQGSPNWPNSTGLKSVKHSHDVMDHKSIAQLTPADLVYKMGRSTGCTQGYVVSRMTAINVNPAFCDFVINRNSPTSGCFSILKK